MSNAFNNPTIFAERSLQQLENACVTGNLVFRGYEGEWRKSHNGYKPGQSISLTCPVYFRAKSGAAVDVVDLVERSITMSLTNRWHVAWELTSEEQTYNIDSYSERFLKPAMEALANKIDISIMNLYKYIPNQVGTPGVTPKDFLTFALANSKLTEHATPQDNRNVIINPDVQAYMLDHLKSVFNPGMTGPAIERAKLPPLATMNAYVSNNVAMHTCGTSAGVAALAVDTPAPAEGATGITIDNGSGDWTTTLTEGDIFTIAGVFGVNPVTGASTGKLRQFVVRTAASDAGTESLVSCCPGVSPNQIYSASATEAYLPYQNVVSLPAENDVVTVAGSTGLVHPVNMAFHRDALALAMVELNMPQTAVWGKTMNHKGFSIRVYKYLDGGNDKEIIRFDALWAVSAINPFMGTRLAG